MPNDMPLELGTDGGYFNLLQTSALERSTT